MLKFLYLNYTTENEMKCNTKTEIDGEEHIPLNKASPEIQHSIEVNSLQTVLKNLHTQAKNTHDDDFSENNCTYTYSFYIYKYVF